MMRSTLSPWSLAATLLLLGLGVSTPLRAQPLDLASGGPITVTARDGIDWQQEAHVIIARGDARAVRENVTVTADRLIAHYRPKVSATPSPTAAPASTKPSVAMPGGPNTGGVDSGGNEIYQIEAIGNVRIFTATDVATGDHAIYDMDQAVLVLTGHDLKLTRPAEVITARDSLEYWSQGHRAVARGDASVVTADARQVKGDTLVAYTAAPTDNGKPTGTVAADVQPDARKPNGKTADDPLAASGRIEKVEAFGNVLVRTPTDTVTGDRGVYVPDTGIARLGGSVRITRGQNQLNGEEAEVDLKTGISRLTGGGGRIQGLITPNEAPSAKAPAAAKRPPK